MAMQWIVLWGGIAIGSLQFSRAFWPASKIATFRIWIGVELLVPPLVLFLLLFLQATKARVRASLRSIDKIDRQRAVTRL